MYFAHAPFELRHKKRNRSKMYFFTSNRPRAVVHDEETFRGIQSRVPPPPLNNPRALGHDLLDKRLRLLEIRARERMRLYAEIDFSSEAHELQIFPESVD